MKIDKKEIKERHPKDAEIDLVLEIADKTIDFDRDIKVPLYAQAGITETWLINLVAEKIEIYSQSNGKRYNSRNDFQRGEVIQSEFLRHLKVDEILL